MNLLLDTHVAVWAVDDDPRLSAASRAAIEDPDSSLFVSVASVWEIAIKFALKRKGPNGIHMPPGAAARFFADAGFQIMPVLTEHVLALDGLPPVHGDPFDRLIVATALAAPMRLLTQDRRLAAYGPLVVVA